MWSSWYIVLRDDFCLELPTTKISSTPRKKLPKPSTPFCLVHSASIMHPQNQNEDVEVSTVRCRGYFHKLPKTCLKKIWTPGWFFSDSYCWRFPPDNICNSLFKDVVKFYSQRNVHAMRYTTRVKQFWTLGLRHFKGRFARFMGGFKSMYAHTHTHTHRRQAKRSK